MPGVKDQPPSDSEVYLMRQQLEEYMCEHGNDVFEPSDVRRVQVDDFYVHRFFMHVYDDSGDQLENAMNMLINSLLWRKENNVKDLASATVSESLKAKGTLFSRNEDRDGKKLLIFSVRKHEKGKVDMDDMKKFFLYYIERLDRETNGDKLTLVFDCSGCGLKNMDMDIIHYIITVFKNYHPYSLNYILVLEMPWVLNAAWRIIKGWLPARAVKIIKFVTRSNIVGFISEDQLLAAWGGTDTWEYEYVMGKVHPNFHLNLDNGNDTLDYKRLESSELGSENGRDTVTEMTLPNKSVFDVKDTAKNVTFDATHSKDSSNNNVADKDSLIYDPGNVSLVPESNGSSDLVSADYTIRSSSAAANVNSRQTPERRLLSLTPADDVVFTVSSNNSGLVAKVQIRNVFSKVVVFKIKTTNPEKYRVRPSTSIVSVGGSCDVDIHVHQSQLLGSNLDQSGLAGASLLSAEVASSFRRDKFLVTAFVVDEDFEENVSPARLAEMIKNKQPECKYRLTCSLIGKRDSRQDTRQRSGTKEITATSGALANANTQLETLNKKVTQLHQNVSDLHDRVFSMSKMLFYSFVIIIVFQLALLVFFSLHGLQVPIPLTDQEIVQATSEIVFNSSVKSDL